MKNTSAKLEYIISVLLYGTIGLLLQYVNATSELIVLCRSSIGTIVVLLFMLCRRQKVDFAGIRSNFLIITLSGIFLGLNWVTLFTAYQVTSIATASLLNYMAPMIVIAVSPFVLKEKMTVTKAICVIAAFIGVALVSGFLDGGDQNFNFLGVIMGLAAALCFVGVVLCNRKMKPMHALTRCAYQLLVAALVVLPYNLIKNGGLPFPTDLTSILLLIVLGVLQTGFAYIFYFNGLASLPVQSVAILGYLEPLVTVITGVLILGQYISVWGIIGAVLILGAAVFSELSGKKKA